MIKTAMRAAAAAILLLAGPASAANRPGVGRAHAAPTLKRCKPPTRLVWAVVRAGGPLQWSCYAAPESDCRGDPGAEVPVYVAAKQGWVCRRCPKGDVVATARVEGIVVGHCKRP